MIEKIHQQATPEVVAAVRAGTLSINAAAAVATLPAEEQAAAAQAGADELKQVAKRVRDAKRKPKAEEGSEAAEAGGDTLDSLRQRVAALEAENAELRVSSPRWAPRRRPEARPARHSAAPAPRRRRAAAGDRT
jgi:hypothetical protein